MSRMANTPNENGLTFYEWFSATKIKEPNWFDSKPRILYPKEWKAWRSEEDPTDWNPTRIFA